MNTHAIRRGRTRALVQRWMQACLIALLINLLVFPPDMLAGTVDSTQYGLSWNGGTGNWTDSNWACSSVSADCSQAGGFPNNGDGISTANTYLATIGTGSDNVTIDGSSQASSISIDGLSLGASDGSGSSQLNLANQSLTIGGTPSSPSSLLTINGGGTLNVQTGGTLTLQTTTSDTVGISNAGTIGIGGTGALQLSDAGAGATFDFTQGGTNGGITLSGQAQITGGSGNAATLLNDTGHIISGSGTILNLAVSNNGTITASGGNLTIDTTYQNVSGQVFSNNSGGSVNVNDGYTLTLSNSNTSGSNAYFENDGNINVGQTTGASLVLQGNSTASTIFDVTSASSSGNIYLNGASGISGYYGNEQLINDTGHTITVNSGASATISNLQAFTNYGLITATGNLTFDTTTGGSFYNASTINANDGSTLTLRNISPTGSGITPNNAVFQNDGAINIGSNPSSSGATLILDSTDGTNGATGTGTVFDLQVQNGGGTLNLYGNSTIKGQTGTEGLINDYYHTIVATAGSTGTITNLASISNNGNIQVGDGNGPASLTIDTSTSGKQAGSFSNNYLGGDSFAQVSVLDGGTLTLQNTTNHWAAFNNDGVITVGASTGAALQFNSGGKSTNFVLSSQDGTGLLALLGTSTISGVSGAERLINGYNHTISVGVDQNGDLISSNATISGLAKFTNNGTIDVGGYQQTETLTSAQGTSSNHDGTSTPTIIPTLTIDTTNPTSPGSFSNGSQGTIFVADGSSLAFQNTSTTLTASTAVFNNDGLIYLGQNTGATLYLNDGKNGTTFDLTSKQGSGFLVMNGTSAISGVNGTESLINDGNGDVYHSIYVGVDYCGCTTVPSNATISNLAGFTNNGNIAIGGIPGEETSSQGPSSLTIDTTNPLSTSTTPGSFSNGYNGQIFVADGSSLTFQNTSTTLPAQNGAPTAVFNNDGFITLGENTGATLYLNDGKSGTTFDLTSQQSPGFLVLEGSSAIGGVNGTESLINDTGHTIAVDGGASGLISNLASFTNNGSVLVGDPAVQGSYASLTFDTSNGGSFHNGGSGTIDLTDDSHLSFRHQSADPTNPDTAIFKNDGTIVLGSGLPQTDGATLYLDSSDGNGGNGTSTTFKLTGSGSLTIYGQESGITGVTGTESLINDTSHTIIAGNGSNAFVSNLASFVNNGTIQVGDQNGPGSFTIDTSADAASFSNSAKANINVGAGSALIFQNVENGSAAFNNDGTITLNGAALQFNGNQGYSFTLTSNNGTGQLIMNGTSSISSFYGGWENITNSAGHTIVNNGTGTISNLYSFTNGGTLNVAAGSLSISTTDPQFTNTGTVTVGTANIREKQNVTQTAFGTSPGVSMTVDGSFANSGSVTIYGGATLNVNGVPGDGGSTGNYTQTGGVTTIEAGGLLSVNTTDFTFYLQDGTLTGGGELDANLDQTGGTLSPGDPQSFTIDGNYSLGPAGALDFDLAGFTSDQYDHVIVDGSVSLDSKAELEISSDDLNFLSQLQGDGPVDFLDVLSWGAGDEPLTLLSNSDDNGYSLSLVQDPNNSNEADLLVSYNSSATPEPGTFSMLFGAILLAGGLAFRRRRKVQADVA